MQRTYLTLVGLVMLLVVLSACGKSGTSGAAGGEPGAPGTVAATGRQSTALTPQEHQPTPTPFASPAPAPQGLSLRTDRSSYRPADTVTVTLTNTSSLALYSWDTRASCTIFGLEILTQGKWQPASVARCSLGRPALMVTLAPGEVYHANIQARTPGLDTVTFPPGTYRVTLAYATVPTLQEATNQAVSASFEVQN